MRSRLVAAVAALSLTLVAGHALAQGAVPTINTNPSNAAQAHTDAIAPQSAAGTSAATAVTVQGSASGVALKTSEANSAAIAANTAPGGSGALTAIGTPATNGTALLAGSKGTELYLNANDTVTLAIEPASVCGVSAPSYTATVQGGSSGAVIPEALTNQVMCVTAKTGTPGSRPY